MWVLNELMHRFLYIMVTQKCYIVVFIGLYYYFMLCSMWMTWTNSFAVHWRLEWAAVVRDDLFSSFSLGIRQIWVQIHALFPPKWSGHLSMFFGECPASNPVTRWGVECGEFAPPSLQDEAMILPRLPPRKPDEPDSTSLLPGSQGSYRKPRLRHQPLLPRT